MLAPPKILRNILLGYFTLTAAMTGDAAAAECAENAQLLSRYSDLDCDLLADPPAHNSALRNPGTLVWAYAPIEDPTIYAELFRPFTQHLKECTQRQIIYYPVLSEEAQIAALQRGPLHFAGFGTGATVAAVRQAGAHPFAAKGSDDGVRRYTSIAIVRSSSPFASLKELVGHRVAHTSYQSNSGHSSALHFFPENGLTPFEDYTPIMTGGHGQSILGLVSGDYDMAVVASDVFERMAKRGRIDRADFRILFTSPSFPTSSFAYAHDLEPSLKDTLRDCFFSFEFSPLMVEEFQGDTRFVPVNYQKDWLSVRAVSESGIAMQN